MKNKRKLYKSIIFSLITIILFLGVVIQAQGKEAINRPKYVFLFIGDGMSQGQINVTQVYLSSISNDEINLKRLGFTKFPIVGSIATQDLTSFCPDSALTATAMGNGYKTYSGVIGFKGDGKGRPENLIEKMKRNGYKVGIVTSVSLNHATPAGFYAHSISRSNVNEIAMQMPTSNVDYFGGGSINLKEGLDESLVFRNMEKNGYKIVNSKEDIMDLNKNSGKVYAINPILQDSKSIPYMLDNKKGDLELKDFVKKAIDTLDNDKGFFIMAESGKIDWACHSNDGKTLIGEVISLDKAVNEAIKFYNKHPKETLILVTADHETGGISIGNATNKYDTHFKILEKQKISHVIFDEYIKSYKESNKENYNINEIMSYIKENYGLIRNTDKEVSDKNYKDLILSNYEYSKIERAFNESMKNKKVKDEETKVLYGGYEPITVTVTHILNNKAGIGWSSYYHTAMPVTIYAMGQGAEEFTGYYDNTDIFKKLVNIIGLT